MSMIKKLYNWMGEKINSPSAPAFLGLIFYIEAIFFLPTDPILILYCLHNNKKSLYYATIATVASVAGGITSYSIGLTMWNYMGDAIMHTTLVSYILPYETFMRLSALYQQYQHAAILVASFTPIPYKAAALSAGFCNLALIPFIICSMIGRSGRFFLLGSLIYFWGDQIQNYIQRYFNTLALAVLLFVGLVVWLINY